MSIHTDRMREMLQEMDELGARADVLLKEMNSGDKHPDLVNKELDAIIERQGELFADAAKVSVRADAQLDQKESRVRDMQIVVDTLDRLNGK